MELCADCGDDATTTGREWAGFDVFIDVALCDDCKQKRDNYEPPDPDGEDIFRDHRAEARDNMIAAQRMK